MKRNLTDIAFELACEHIYDFTYECPSSYIDDSKKCDDCVEDYNKALDCWKKYFKIKAKYVDE